ncbi:unnamed protein product [Brassica napus]|uniref:(rape) hypothetical protein n=1 Tax=Brassica napus TaxID=3708 RepID=A0A816SZ14_BRANA|nr:unnamed protein product [Brassica napus]
MNLENIDALNSPEADMESSRASGTKTNGSDDTEGESSSVNYESGGDHNNSFTGVNKKLSWREATSICLNIFPVFRGVATLKVRAMKEVWNIASVSTGIKNSLLLKDATTLVMVAMEAPRMSCKRLSTSQTYFVKFTFQFLDIFPNALLLLEVVSAGI